LQDRQIASVHRTGKHIVMELGSSGDVIEAGSSHGKMAEIPAQWIVHLGMTGRLLVTTPDAPVAKHTHARLTLASGRELRFVDPRRFGRLEFRDLRKLLGFAGPGAEPLTIGAEAFARLFHGRKLAIKAALLNQTLLAGVGNIYADEGLFRAGIRPRRRAGQLTRVELEKLRGALREVLVHAVFSNWSTVCTSALGSLAAHAGTRSNASWSPDGARTTALTVSNRGGICTGNLQFFEVTCSLFTRIKTV
jgi:formamidopyrimidine-DNA glycosylase